jgi:flagellar hook-basal body complex protein FliE
MAIERLSNPAAAAGAYATTQKVAQDGGASGGDGFSFGDLLKKVTLDSIGTVKAGEKVSADAILGKADLTDVMQAVNASEMTLQTVSAIRDKMLQAYQDIMRTPI